MADPQVPAHRVAVFGASGHTGRFVVSELLRRGLAPVAVARRPAPDAPDLTARGVVVRTATIEEPATLDRAFSDVGAVINCAGPFLDTAQAVAAAALRAGAHYLDVTAEQASVQATFERFDGPARAAGLVVMPAVGFYGGFADLLAAAAMGDWPRAEEIRIGIGLDSWRPTKGTRVTGARNTARRQVIAGGQLAPLPDPAPRTTWSFPEPFGEQAMVAVPFSEVVLIARRGRTARLDTFLGEIALRDLRDPATPEPGAADASGLSAQRFIVEVVVRRDGDTRRAAARGRDIYGFTAPLVVQAAQRILDDRTGPRGGLAPSEAFDAYDFLTALPLEELTVDTGPRPRA